MTTRMARTKARRRRPTPASPRPPPRRRSRHPATRKRCAAAAARMLAFPQLFGRRGPRWGVAPGRVRVLPRSRAAWPATHPRSPARRPRDQRVPRVPHRPPRPCPRPAGLARAGAHQRRCREVCVLGVWCRCSSRGRCVGLKGREDASSNAASNVVAERRWEGEHAPSPSRGASRRAVVWSPDADARRTAHVRPRRWALARRLHGGLTLGCVRVCGAHSACNGASMLGSDRAVGARDDRPVADAARGVHGAARRAESSVQRPSAPRTPSKAHRGAHDRTLFGLEIFLTVPWIRLEL